MHPDYFLYVPKKGNGYVYHITSGQKHYIGISTTPFSKRWLRHKAPWSGCTKLVRELKRLKATGNWNQLSVLILQLAPNKQLDRLEKRYIKKYGSFNSLYGMNSTPGGRLVTPDSMHRKAKKKATRRKLRRLFKPVTWSQVTLTADTELLC